LERGVIASGEREEIKQKKRERKERGFPFEGALSPGLLGVVLKKTNIYWSSVAVRISGRRVSDGRCQRDAYFWELIGGKKKIYTEKGKYAQADTVVRSFPQGRREKEGILRG